MALTREQMAARAAQELQDGPAPRGAGGGRRKGVYNKLQTKRKKFSKAHKGRIKGLAKSA